jgi:hypothetical protein
MDILLRIAVIGFFAIPQCTALLAKEQILAPGVTELDAPLVLSGDDLQLMGAPGGSTLKASARFEGPALIVARGLKRLSISRLKIDGNRAAHGRPIAIAPYDQAFRDFYDRNGILIDDCDTVILRDLEIRQVAHFPILVSRSQHVRIQQSRIEYSGTLDAAGKNNTTGGILLEEGTSDFEIRFVKLFGVRGNGIWTHSRYESPRNRDGLIQENEVNGSARDAIQIGHATNIRVLKNVLVNIGFPVREVDMAHGGIPVGIDTAGNVDQSLYAENLIQEVNGKCIDLDGFHHGEIRSNRCYNRLLAAAYPQGHFGIVLNNTNPDMRSEAILIEDNEIEGMRFGGIFLIGREHIVRRNRMRFLNLAGCTESHGKGAECYFGADQPDLLRSGIYFGLGAERPDKAHDIRVEDNLITGHLMKQRCLAYAPGVSAETMKVSGNVCIDAERTIQEKKKK